MGAAVSDISRRTFLSASGLALAGLAACSKGGTPPVERPASGTLSEILAGRRQTMALGDTGVELLSGREERIALGLIDPVAQKPIGDATGRMWFAKALNAEAIGPFPIREVELPRAPNEPARGLYVALATVPDDGTWFQLVEATPPGASEPLVGV